MRILFLIAIISFLPFNGSGQAIFTYGKQSVDVKEFLRAFNKNNSQPAAKRAAAIRDYLDLYINSRLKIREAYERKYDTLPQVAMEVANLRNQIAQNYMNDPSISAKLQREAFLRSQKDIHIAHIFISFKKTPGITDTIAAGQKRNEVVEKLKKGEDFSKLAQTFSDDTTARQSGGDLGWITVFTLPYPLENIAYELPVGKYSQPIASKSGYHIIKKLGERKAVGKMKAKQILVALPPGASDADKKRAGALADSLYKLIQKGSRFETLATSYSNDYISAATGGTIPDIGVGQFDPVFEKMAWSLTKDSAVSKPFLTSHGWHILKRIEVKPVVTDSTNQSNRQDILSLVMADSRWKASKEFIFNKLADKGLYSTHTYSSQDLFLYTDSVIRVSTASVNGRITGTTAIFKLGDTLYGADDWVRHARIHRVGPDGSTRNYYELVEEWKQERAKEYFLAHLEDFNEEFRNQMAEFKDGNLFFEIMQQEIWNKAQNDTAALESLFEKNKTKYNFEKAADAVIFFCSDATVANEIYAAVKKNPADWKKIRAEYADRVVADSSRFELFQLPLAPKTVPAEGLVGTPVVNTNDNSASFAYIIKVFTKPVPRSFSEAKGLVITDYQEVLEKTWIENLKKKYPVVVDQKVLSDISR